MRIEKKRVAARRGAVIVKIAIFLPVIVGIVALNLDGGRMLEERRRAQTTADAAAQAAAAELYANYQSNQGLDPSRTAQAAAESIAVANGYPKEAVTVSIPPTSGQYAGQSGHVEVVLNSSLEASFGKIFTGHNPGVNARSVARGQPLQIGIIALQPTGGDAIVNTSAALAVLNKPIIVNSDSAGAFRQGGFGTVVAGRIDINGTILNPGGALLLGRVRTGVRPTLDPLAFLPVPSSGSIQSSAPMVIDSLLPTILSPGVYRGGLRIRGASVVVMLPGVYIMEGGGFRVEQLATVAGLGTMVYNTTSPTYPSGPVSISGLGKVEMTAPLGGTYQGINVFQNRAMTQPITITGLGQTTITGTVYAASAAANVTGGAAVGLDILGGAYVVRSMTIGGIGSVTINLNLNPPKIPDVRLVE